MYMRASMLRPVLALGAAGAGVDLDVGVVAVGFARKQCLDLLATRVRRQLAQRGLAFLDGGFVFFGFAELDQRDAHRRDRARAFERR